MNKFAKFLEEKLMPIAAKIAAQRHLGAVRDGMQMTIPFILIGSLFLILASFPVNSYLAWMTAHPAIKNALLEPYNGTFQIMTLIATFATAYRLGESYKVDALASGITALAAFFVITPYTAFVTGTDPVKHVPLTTTAMPQTYFTSAGLFVGLLVALLTAEIYRKLVQKDIVIKMPEGVPPTVAKSFTAIIPGFIAIAVVWVIRMLIEDCTPYGNVHAMFTKLIGAPLTHIGTSYWGSLVVFILVVLLWSVGLHGANIVGSVMTPIWYTLTGANATANAAGHPVQNIVTYEFHTLFYLGGSGVTLGLVLAMLFFSKSKQMKTLGKLAIGPGIFNVNEPVIFGMPIVLNPIMIIPFLIAPAVIFTVAYWSMALGFVPKPIGVSVPFTVPMLLGGYVITGSIKGAILQVVLLVLSFAIYFPFFKIWDGMKYKEEQEAEVAASQE